MIVIAGWFSGEMEELDDGYKIDLLLQFLPSEVEQWMKVNLNIIKVSCRTHLASAKKQELK